MTKIFWGAPFGTFCSRYQIVSSKDTFRLVVIRTEWSIIRDKSLTYTKIPHKSENLSKMMRGSFFGTFCTQYWIVLSERVLHLRNWWSFKRRHSSFEPIRREGSVIQRKSLAFTKIHHKTKNLSKTFRGVLFGTFCTQY